MARQRADFKAVTDLVAAYSALLPILPLIGAAVEAEQEAPGYGAEAVVFRWLTAEAGRARRG